MDDRRPRCAARRQSRRMTMSPSFINSSGSPTTLPSLLLRTCHAPVSGISWVVKVPGTTSTPASTMLLIGPAHTTIVVVLLLFLQKQNLANAIYLFGLGTLLSCIAGVGAQLVFATTHKRVLTSEGNHCADHEIRNIRVAGQTDLLVDFTVLTMSKVQVTVGRLEASSTTPTTRTTSSRAPLPTRSAIIATHIAATGMWLFCRRACLPRAASTATLDFLHIQQTGRRLFRGPWEPVTSRTARSFVTVAASSSSNTGAPSGWHVLMLWRYVALPPPRAATSLPLAARRPSTWPTMIMTGMSASTASPRTCS